MKLAVRRSLKTKMTLAVFLLVVCTITLGGFLALRHFERALKENIASQQFALISKIARDIDSRIAQAREIIVKTAATIPLPALEDPDQAQAFLDRRLGVATQIIFDNGIFLFGRDGRMIAESPFKPGRRGRDYSFRKYFRRTIEEQGPIISDPYFSSQAHNHPAINFTAPIFDSEGTLVAVLAGSLDLTRENFLGGLSQIVLGRTGYLYLYKSDRLMIMHPVPSRILQKDVPPGANLLFDRALEGFEGTGETVNSRGLHALASFKHLTTVDWILAANYPVDEAFAPVARARENFFLGLGIILLLTILTVWFLMEHLTAPLLRLTRHIENISSGEAFREELPVPTRDEIGLLTNSFNQMMTELSSQRRVYREQAEFLQTLIDTMPNAIYFKDLRNRYLGCNIAFERIHGVERADLIGKTSLETGTPAPVLEKSDRELLDQRETSCQIFETSMVYADGSPHDLILYQAVFRNFQDDPGGMVGTLVDISRRKTVETALAEQREFTENLLQNSAVPCFVLDTNHQILTWTRACEELTGIPAVEVLGTDEHWKAFYDHPRPCLADLILDENLGRMVDLYESFADSPLIPNGVQAEDWFTLNEKSKYLRFEAAPIHDSSGNLIAAIETLQDLTSLKQQEQALQEGEANYRVLVERSPDAIVVHRQGRVIFANEAAAALFGASHPQEIAGVDLLDLVHPDDHELARQRIGEVENAQAENPYIEEKLLRLDGSSLVAEVASNPVFHGGQWAVQTILRDITERKELERRVWRQANFDSLTGLPNRLLFLDRLQQGLDRAQREGYLVVLMFIDLDHFKEVNDTLGHAAGDRLLQDVARRLKTMMRRTDTVARMGGDEFTIIMPRIEDPSAVDVVARRVINRLSEPYELSGGTGRISASIGIAFYPDDGSTIEDLMRHADSAMYCAKENGRGDYRRSRRADTAGKKEKEIGGNQETSGS